MKRIRTILAVILLVIFAGCGNNKHLNDNLIIVDVSKSYPKKELILQDLMDVEYIALETSDEFLTQGVVQGVGKKYLVVNNRINDGVIFIFDRKTGKGVRKINRQGQGPEEYAGINNITLDETNGELFVQSPGNKIMVYDLHGTFKRCLSFSMGISSILDYDKDNLICYDLSDYFSKGEDRSKSYHIIVSKLDGSITKEIFIPFKTINTPVVIEGDQVVAGYFSQMRPSYDNWILMETSSDTLYSYTPDGTLSPLVVRTPSAHAMEPEVFLYMGIHTDRYYFMEAIKNEFDFETGNGFYSDELMYDKEENAIFQFKVYNDDYAEKTTVAMTARSINREIEGVTSLGAFRLVEAHKEDKLKDGKLKEIASRLHEDDNPVIMLIKHKK